MALGCGTGVGNFEAEINDLVPDTKYYIRAYAVNRMGKSYGEVISFVTAEDVPPTSGTINGYDWVDLGLASGTKWATCNVGASSPEEYGEYYAWGETETKGEYTANNSLTHGVSIGDISGDPTYDVARKKWEGSWRMPNKAEMQELFDDCTWIRITQNGINGYKVSGPNGNSVFLPASGSYGYDGGLTGIGDDGAYWSSTPYNDASKSCAYNIAFFGSMIGFGAGDMRYYGQNVRPVTD